MVFFLFYPGEVGSVQPRKLLLVDTSLASGDRKSPDRHSVRSRSMSNDSMPPFMPIEFEEPDIIDLDAYIDSFTDSPSTTPVKVKKKKKRDKSKQKGEKSHKKDKRDKNGGGKSPRKRDRLEKHSKMMKAKLRAEEALRSSGNSGSSSASSGGVASGNSGVLLSSPHKHKVKSSKPAGKKVNICFSGTGQFSPLFVNWIPLKQGVKYSYFSYFFLFSGNIPIFPIFSCFSKKIPIFLSICNFLQ